MKSYAKWMTLAAVGLAVARPARADTLVITFASGKVQTIELAGNAKDIKEVTVGETSAPLSEKVRKLLLGTQTAPDRPGGKDSSQREKKSTPLLKWAPPVSE